MADPSSIARVSGRDAVFAPMYLMMRFQAEACIVVDDPHQMRFFFFRLRKISDFRFCFYHLMIEADAYLYWVSPFWLVFFFF